MAKKKQELDLSSISILIDTINRTQGVGSITQGAKTVKCDAIQTGALNLDLALGVGGVPYGRITEIYGPESSGKTTVALHLVANVQKSGGVAAYIDAEHALDPTYASAIGVDMDKLLISQPDSGEQALEVADLLCKSGLVKLVVVDSVAALVPKAELEGTMGESHIGLQARLLSQACRKLKGVVNDSGAALVFINQLREKVGVMFGNPEVTSGGRALRYYASVRIDIRRTSTIKDGDESLGNQTCAKIVKNKVGAPYKQAQFDIIFGKGINKSGCILDLGVEYGIVDKKSSYYTYNDLKLGNGRVTACKFLDDNIGISDEINSKVMQKFMNLNASNMVDDEHDEVNDDGLFGHSDVLSNVLNDD